jgi:dUTP pyrophosphatase
MSKRNKTRGFEFITLEQWLKDVPSHLQSNENLYMGLKLPKRATRHSAGYDVFAPFTFVLDPNKDIKIPTGFKAYMSEDEMLVGHIRSSIGFKYYTQLANTTMIGDGDYYNNPNNEGHYWIKIRNNGNTTFTINKGEAFAQVIFQKFLLADDDSFNEGEIRKGGIGSTNND